MMLGMGQDVTGMTLAEILAAGRARDAVISAAHPNAPAGSLDIVSSTAVGPPGSIVMVDAGDGTQVAAKLNDKGEVESMWQVGGGSSPAGVTPGFKLDTNTLLLFGGGLLAVMLLTGVERRR